jgi:hypothetical protein
VAAAFLLTARIGQTQEPAPQSPPATQPQPSTPAPATPSNSKHQHTHADDFLIRGTVFTDKALAFPGVQLRIRRVGDRKFRWQDVTNSRGNFAIRVPQGYSYEVLTHTKGCLDQSKTIDAKKGLIEQSLVFEMQPAGGKK